MEKKKLFDLQKKHTKKPLKFSIMKIIFKRLDFIKILKKYMYMYIYLKVIISFSIQLNSDSLKNNIDMYIRLFCIITVLTI